jgi:signal transduction histidine kinase
MFESIQYIKNFFAPTDAGSGNNGSPNENGVPGENEKITGSDESPRANEQLTPSNKKLTDLTTANKELKSLINDLTVAYSDLKAMNKVLSTTNNDLIVMNEDYRTSNKDYRTSNKDYRTSNEDLTKLNHELSGSNLDLRTSNAELDDSNKELTISNSDLKTLNHELVEARRSALNLLEDANITEALLATDLANMRLLVALSEKLVSNRDIRENFSHILDGAITITEANAGTIQILNTKTQQLEIVASKGFSKNIVNFFEFVDASSNTSCGIALRKNKRVFLDFNVPAEQDPDGTLRMHVEDGILSAQSTPLVGHSGTAIGMITTHFKKNHRPSYRELYFIDLLARQAADMVESKKAEEAIRKSEEQLKQFNVILEEQVRQRTGELKNFNSIAANNYAETLRHVYINLETIVTTDARNLSNSSRANIRRAQAAVQKMKLLTNDINHYLELYDVTINKQLIDPNEILIYVKEKMQKRIEDSNATINVAKLPKLTADSLLFSTAITHIIDNSIKFKKTDIDPVINISSSLIADAGSGSKANDNKTYTIITITDNGVGFNPEDADKAFELFTQLDDTHKGSGIGLTICKKIMEMHGGFINAESEPGKGASIHCYFPS